MPNLYLAQFAVLFALVVSESPLEFKFAAPPVSACLCTSRSSRMTYDDNVSVMRLSRRRYVAGGRYIQWTPVRAENTQPMG